MADDSTRRKRDGKGRSSRLPPLEEILKRSQEFLDKDKPSKKSKNAPLNLEFSKDPRSGLRSVKGTYKERKTKPAEKSDGSATESPLCEHWVDHAVGFSSSDDMDGVVKAATEFVQQWEGDQAPKQTWASRTATLQESWEESRPILLESMIKCFQVPDVVCYHCKKSATIRCQSCSPGKVLCGNCDIKYHQYHPFHNREALLSDYAAPIEPLVSRKYNDNGQAHWCIVGKSLPPGEVFCCKCNGRCWPEAVHLETHLIVVTLEGRFDLNNQSYKCDSCGDISWTSYPNVLIQLGFWPGSITNTSYAFQQDLFKYWNTLQKLIPGISETSFIKSLEQFSCSKERVGIINSATFKKSFKEWKYCQFSLDRIAQLDWMVCPACYAGQHSVHIDGNMKLYRFQQAGSRKKECYYGETFVASNAKVDEHIQKVYQRSSKKRNDGSNQCGDTSWRAAANTLRKKKNICETGLEISGCRHALAQHAVSMMVGEIYGYGHYLQKTYYVGNTEFFWYDVCCKYWPWLKRHDPDTASKMKPALSIMHGKAHSWHCQAIWGGRWQEGAAGTTGEEVEQINSHFSRLGSSTKHMLPEAREELLTEHALSWNKQKIKSLPKLLVKRYLKAQSQIQKLEVDINQLSENVGLPVPFHTWKSDVLSAAREEEMACNTKIHLRNEEIKYLGHVLYLKEKASPLQKALFEAGREMCSSQTIKEISVEPSFSETGEKSLKAKAVTYIQRAIQSCYYAIAQFTYNMGKMADSSKQRDRLRKKITATKERALALVDIYKPMVDSTLTLADIEAGEFPWSTSQSGRNEVPVRRKRDVIEKMLEQKRYREELTLLKGEMVSFLNYFKNKLAPALKKQIEDLKIKLKGVRDRSFVSESNTHQSNRYESNSLEEGVVRGKLALLIQANNYAMQLIAVGVSSFGTILSKELDEFDVSLQPQPNTSDDIAMEPTSVSEEEEEEEEEDDNDEEVGDAEYSIARDAGVLEIADTVKIFATELCSGIYIWKFPVEFSQGVYNGRNGSNACSVIALAIGKRLFNNAVFPDVSAVLSPALVAAVCASMDYGNHVYDKCRSDLPSRYLSVQEAATILTPWMDVETSPPFPVRLVDLHTPSTISEQLREGKHITQKNQCCFASLVINNKTSMFVLGDRHVLYIDSHGHRDSGAVVIQANMDNLDEFCNAIWNFEGYSEQTFGNLSFVYY